VPSRMAAAEACASASKLSSRRNSGFCGLRKGRKGKLGAAPISVMRGVRLSVAFKIGSLALTKPLQGLQKSSRPFPGFSRAGHGRLSPRRCPSRCRFMSALNQPDHRRSRRSDCIKCRLCLTLGPDGYLWRRPRRASSYRASRPPHAVAISDRHFLPLMAIRPAWHGPNGS
jgi:hypothetical protein